MAKHLHHTHFDITRKLEEFGFGPSDSEDEDDLDCVDQSSFANDDNTSNDWECIGLLPSWNKLQLTVRNVSYSLLTTSKLQNVEPEKSTLPSLITADTIVSCNDTSTTRKVQNNTNNIEFNDEGLVETPCNENVCSKLLVNCQALEDTIEQADTEVDSELDESDANDSDSEWEEIGRFPTFEQLQFTLRNASGMMGISSLFPTEFRTIPKIFNPADLFAKYGAPVNGSALRWHGLVENFQLPSFFEEHSGSEDEDVHYDEAELAELCSDEGLTAEDRAVGYNADGHTGCEHYLRNCKSECSKCHRFYMCQICHDNAQGECIIDSIHDHNHQTTHKCEPHEMNRQETRRMLCLYCQRPQPVRRKCRFCKEIMGDYYCSICKLWNDDPNKSIYHCDKCGICRVGRGLGIDVFHCDTCGICLSLSVQNNHKCIEQAAKSNCPICLDDLFASPKPTMFMLCGHPIHRECFNEYTKRYYKCPICAKSILNTSALFRMIDEEIQHEVLPPELMNKQVYIICLDCRLKSRTQFHLAGLKCETCGSYNTTQM